LRAAKYHVSSYGCEATFGGETYTDLILAQAPPLVVGGRTNYLNAIGLPFLARHLVTLDFPRRTMYLKRSAVDFYEKHDQPKQIWVRELVKKACVRLRAAELPAQWAEVLPKVQPRCTAKADEIASLMERLRRDLPEFRRQQSLAYPIAGMLALNAMATFSGVTKGYEDLADYAATLSQGQLRALRFRLDVRTGRVRCPQRTTFQRVLTGVNAEILERVLLLWQEQVPGPAQG